MNAITLRDATPEDCAAIQAIYADHVENGVASFEEAAPNIAEMTRRMQDLKNNGFPYRVAELDGVVRGYSYAGPYRPRLAYRFTVENSIYIEAGYIGTGIGGKLMEDLIGQCQSRGFRQMVAIISDTEGPSIDFHGRYGFENCGVLRSVGLKHGGWVDTVMMQRSLGEGDETLP
jgi:phosphinothricin acetyltransferase